MKNIKLLFSAFLLGSLVMSCNSDPDDLGVQLFEEGASKGIEQSYDLVTYNIDNQNVIKSDASVLHRASLGVFNEAQFGMQKSAYFTQIRMTSYNPSFGENPIVDSVSLEIIPEYLTSSEAVTKIERDITYKGEAAKEIVTSYKTVKYGNEALPLTIQVHEVNEDLGSVKDEIKSNRNVVVSTDDIGSKSFDGNAIAVNINKKSDNTNLLSKKIAIRIPLKKEYFQNKIIAKNGATELKDETEFVKYFKGLKISVQQNDGYFINFNPNEVKLVMYYTSGGANDRKSNIYEFDLGSSNVHFSQINANRSNIVNNILTNIDATNGDKLIYMQGMGGSGAGIKMTGATFETLKDLYKNQKSAIISAKIRLYTDVNTWNNSYTKPTGFLVNKKGETSAIPDILAMINNVNYKLVKTYSIDSNPTYYDIDVTKTVKDIVEQNAEAKDLELNLGDYLVSNSRIIVTSNSSAYTPYRVVFVGTDLTNNNRVKLLVTSVTK